jgi:hypothetical protein
MADSKINGGEVILSLSGEEVALVPSIGAALSLSKQYGGLRNCMMRILDFDIETILNVVYAGANVTSAKKREEISQALFEAGMDVITLKVIDYVNMLANGGKLPVEGEAEDPKKLGTLG